MTKEIIELTVKPVINITRVLFLHMKNKNKFFVEDFAKKDERQHFYFKKLGCGKWGVFDSRNDKEPIRVYEKPNHETPKKFAKQYAKKLAMKQAKKTSGVS